MTGSDNHSGNQRNQWGSEDWRLLVITFVGGLASIIVGAGALGLAVALARFEKPGDNIFTWVFFVTIPVLTLIFFVSFVRQKQRGWIDNVLMWGCAAVVIISILVWIGAAAGIH